MALGDLSRIECAFAEAAVDQTLWERALDVVTRETDSFGAVLLPVSGVAIPNTPATESLHRVSEQYFRDEFHLRDQRHAGVPVFMKTGIMDDSDCIDLDLMKRHSYYQEFLAPHGLRWFAGVKVACRDEIWCLSIQRRIEQGPFPAEDKLRLAALSQNLSTSAVLAQALAVSAVNGALNAFELSNMAIALVNRHGDVYRVNKAAETLLKGDVRICGRKILSFNAEASASLSRAISRLIWQPSGASLAAPIVLPRRNKSPLIAYLAKLSVVAANALADCQAIVILLDPDERQAAPETLLQSAFSLTPTEARLASRIGTGALLEDVSNELQITRETARTHLKHVFMKMGIGRQSELVALVSSMARYKRT